MSWVAVGSAAVATAGSIASAPSAPKSYIPRKETRIAEADRIASRSNLLFGGTRRDGNAASGGLEALYNNPENFPKFGPRPFSDINPYEAAAIQQLGGFATQAFPDLYQPYANTVKGQIQNGGGSDAYANSFRNLLPQMQQMFQQGPGTIQAGNVNFQPGVQNQTTADPNAAINQMLSGNLDTSKLQGAMNSYMQPIMENFNEQIMPSLFRADAAATGGGSSAGALKAAQRVQEQIGEGANAQAQGLLYQASQDALNRQVTGAGLAQQGRLADVGNQLTAQQMMSQIMQGNADRGLAGQVAGADNRQNFINSLMQAGGIGAGAASDADRNRYAFSSLMPDVLQQGLAGPQALTMAGAGARALLDPYAQYAADQFNYQQQLPFQMGNQWMNILNQASPPGNVPAQTQGGQPRSTTGAAISSGLAQLMATWPQARPAASPAPYAPRASGSPAATPTFNPALAGIQ